MSIVAKRDSEPAAVARANNLLTAAVTGVVATILTLTVGREVGEWVALALFITGGAWLSVYDAREHRIPNAILFPLAAAIAGILLALTATTGDWARLGVATAFAAALWALYAALWLAKGIGWGDVKLGALIGLWIGWYGLEPVIIATVLAYLLALPHALALIVRRRRTDTSTTPRLPFGPYMVAGALAAAMFTLLG
jgi:leader peptidase (prepilin peptidase)/N-methyltransferase